MPKLIEAAQRNPSETLWLDTKTRTLQVCRNGVGFAVGTRASMDWWGSELKMKQYSKITNFIRSKRAPTGYTAVFPLPLCIVSYKWRDVLCKVQVPEGLPPVSRSDIFDRFYNDIPSGGWKYYEWAGSLVIDYHSDVVYADSSPYPKKIK